MVFSGRRRTRDASNAGRVRHNDALLHRHDIKYGGLHYKRLGDFGIRCGELEKSFGDRRTPTATPFLNSRESPQQPSATTFSRSAPPFSTVSTRRATHGIRIRLGHRRRQPVVRSSRSDPLADPEHGHRQLFSGSVRAPQRAHDLTVPNNLTLLRRPPHSPASRTSGTTSAATAGPTEPIATTTNSSRSRRNPGANTASTPN